MPECLRRWRIDGEILAGVGKGGAAPGTGHEAADPGEKMVPSTPRRSSRGMRVHSPASSWKTERRKVTSPSRVEMVFVRTPMLRMGHPLASSRGSLRRPQPASASSPSRSRAPTQSTASRRAYSQASRSICPRSRSACREPIRCRISLWLSIWYSAFFLEPRGPRWRDRSRLRPRPGVRRCIVGTDGRIRFGSGNGRFARGRAGVGRRCVRPCP